MRHPILTAATASLLLGAATPVLAQDSGATLGTLTCAEFTALEDNDQAKVLSAMTQMTDETNDQTVADVVGNASSGSDSDVTAVQTACAGQDTALVKDVM